MSQAASPLGFCDRCSTPVHRGEPGIELGPPLRCAQCAARSEEPESFGPFEVHGVLGVGAMGEVLKARDTRDDTWCAVKLLRVTRRSSEELQARFMQETQIIGALRHPGIVSCVDQGSVDGIPYLAMEYVDGPNLAEVQRERPRKRIPYGEAIRWTRQLLEALDHAHRRGVVHRDLKPTNILLDGDGQTKILDFGLARIIGADGEDQKRLTGTNQTLGSPHFIAPEQITGAIDADHRADLHAVASMLFRFLTGKFVYQKAKTVALTLKTVAGDRPRRLAEHLPAAPHQLCDAVDRALAKRPESRFQSARAFLDALEGL